MAMTPTERYMTKLEAEQKQAGMDLGIHFTDHAFTNDIDQEAAKARAAQWAEAAKNYNDGRANYLSAETQQMGRDGSKSEKQNLNEQYAESLLQQLYSIPTAPGETSANMPSDKWRLIRDLGKRLNDLREEAPELNLPVYDIDRLDPQPILPQLQQQAAMKPQVQPRPAQQPQASSQQPQEPHWTAQLSPVQQQVTARFFADCPDFPRTNEAADKIVDRIGRDFGVYDLDALSNADPQLALNYVKAAHRTCIVEGEYQPQLNQGPPAQYSQPQTEEDNQKWWDMPLSELRASGMRR